MNAARSTRWPVIVVLVLLALFTLAFVAVFVMASLDYGMESTTPHPDAERVDALLAAADPARGEALITQFDCFACHISAAGVGIAPPFEGVAERAETRRPPLSAAQYIYESIVDPVAYVVEGYAGSMPQNYDERLSDEQLGDLMAYLLTLH